MSNILLDLLSGLTKTGVGNDAASAQYFDSPQQAVSAFAKQSVAPEQISNTYTPGLQFGEGGNLAQEASTPPVPSFLQTQNAVTPKFQKPSFLEAQNNPQVAQKSETKMGKLFQILAGAAQGAGSGAGSMSFGEGFAKAQHADQNRKQIYNQQQQQLIQNQRQAQADKNSQAEADRQAAEAPLNTEIKRQTIDANKRALAVKNQTPAEILAQRTAEADAQHLQGDVRAKYILEGKTPEGFGKTDQSTSEFEAWQKQNPNAPVSEYLKLAHPKQYAGGQDPNSKLLSVTEAQALGVPYGTTREAAFGKKPQKSGPPSEGERRAFNFYMQANQAADNVAAIEPKIAEKGTVGTAFMNTAPNFMQPEENQLYTQAQRQFTEARLRNVSGAAISASEYAKDAKTYFAQPGDSKAVREQKAKARQNVIDSLKKESGRAYTESFGDEAPKAGSAKDPLGIR